MTIYYYTGYRVFKSCYRQHDGKKLKYGDNLFIETQVV